MINKNKVYYLLTKEMESLYIGMKYELNKIYHTERQIAKGKLENISRNK